MSIICPPEGPLDTVLVRAPVPCSAGSVTSVLTLATISSPLAAFTGVVAARVPCLSRAHRLACGAWASRCICSHICARSSGWFSSNINRAARATATGMHPVGPPETVVAGGGLVTEHRRTKEVKMLLEEAGWLCKSPGHKISKHGTGESFLPLTPAGSAALGCCTAETCGDAAPSRCECDDERLAAPAEPGAAAAKLRRLLLSGSATHVSAEGLPPPPVPLARRRGAASGRKRRKKSIGGDEAAGSTNKPSRFTFVELFAGIGGFRIGMEAAGGRCVLASELDVDARQTYEDNFGDDDDGGADVSNDNSGSGAPAPLAGDITRLHSCHVPDHDVLTAGFPCQSFSAAGRQAGLSDGSSGALFHHVVRILREKRPRAFLLENVRGLTTMEGGSTFSTVLRLLREAGYDVFHELIDAGLLLPQTRVRVYIVGFLRHQPQGSSSSSSQAEPLPFSFPRLPDLRRSAAEILVKDNADVISGLRLSEHQWSKVKGSKYFADHPGARLLDPSGHTQTLQASYRSSYLLYSQFVPTGPIKPRAEQHQSSSSSNADSPGDAAPAEQSTTMGSSPEQPPRFLSPRECARLMGFPETFVIGSTHREATGAPSAAAAAAVDDKQHLGADADDRGRGSVPEESPGGRFYRQVGNAACPPVIAAIAARMARLLLPADRVGSASPSSGNNQGPADSSGNKASGSNIRASDELAPALDLVLAALPDEARGLLVLRNQGMFPCDQIQPR